jgi:phosphoribosyl-ATP pyrophosphohydrolase
VIVPSIDLMGGRTVQLIGGKEFALDAGDPAPIAERFARVGEIAVVDLDAALGTGDNASLIEPLVRRFPIRIGGGIRDVAAAVRWLDMGATKVVLGTAATPEVLRELPRERVVAALDCLHGEVVVKGWREGTGRKVADRMAELREHVSGFLVTFVEREGRMQGLDLEEVGRVVEAAGGERGPRVTIAGGVTTPADVAAIDRLGADAQIGMALYTGRLGLAEAFAASLVSDRADGLWPTVVADEHGVALGLVYSSAASLRESIETGHGVYYSRSRGGLWRKGESSGAVQEVLRIDADCDRDALRFTVRQSGTGFCHMKTRTCWGEDAGLPRLARTLASRANDAPTGSYTARLMNEPGLLAAKIKEEAAELVAALDAVRSGDGSIGDVTHETADVMYFALVSAIKAGSSLEAVARELDRRGLRVSRRRGDAKS